MSEDIVSWAARERLPAHITTVLRENGFFTVDNLKFLTPEIIKEEFQDSGKLNLAHCLALRKAVETLTRTPYPASVSFPHHPSPSPHPSSVTATPQSSTPLQHPSSPQSYPLLSPPKPDPALHGSSTNPSHPHLMSASAEGGVPPASYGTCHGISSGSLSSSSSSAECFRFFLLGKTGAGKSTTGNTIFGKKLFNTAASFGSVTSDCERRTNTRNGRKLEIIDSPGLYDSHMTQEKTSVLIVQAVAGMYPGPHAILFVLKIGRYTEEEHCAYERLKALFDEKIRRYMIVVFTFGDMLERQQKSINDLLSSDKTPETLRQVLRECHNRYIVFNNMAANPEPQVERLLQMVRGMVAENGGQPYTCPRYSLVGEGMEEEVARRLYEVEKRDLQRQKYVQQLEQQTKEAENEARRTKEQYQKNEEERQRRMEAKEKRRQQLEEQLQAQIREQQVKFEQYQQELQLMHREQEEQERMMKEKGVEMTEEEKERAQEESKRMKQREQETRAMMEECEERLSHQEQEDEKWREKMDREKHEFERQMEEQRQKDREELEKKEKELQRLWKKQRQEEREAARRRKEMHEREMEKLKSQVTTNNVMEFFTTAIFTIADIMSIILLFI